MVNKKHAIERQKLLPAGQAPEPGRLSLRASLASPNAEAAWKALMKLGAGEPRHESATVGGDWALREVECAREFNFELPEDIAASVELIEQAIQNVMGAQKSVILTFDETSGVYSCLNDLKVPGNKVRELTRISDWFMQELIGSENEVLHSYLTQENRLVGIVVIAEKQGETRFTPQDQMKLDILAPYLASKVLRFRHLQQSLTVPYIQSVVLEVAGQLITAVDQDDIMTVVLESFANRLGFDVCQYVGFNPESGYGEVLFEIRTSPAQDGASAPDGVRVQSFSHAGLEGKRRVVAEYGNMVGLLSSMARNKHYLHLSGKTLGDHELDAVFGVDNIHSALLLPVKDTATGEIRGTFNLFQTTSAAISEESREIAREVAFLASRALGRATVLEKAVMMASSDELTGLINRRGYYQRFEAELERARRHQTSMCVALIDVDHFKRFNDTYGHLSGDLVLKALADLFTQNLRRSDVVCRFGGEEFAILLPDTSMKAAIDLMERVRQNVESMQLCGIHGERLHVTISAGLVPVETSKHEGSERRSEISEALAQADEQLYAAKDQGRNRICYQSA
jgi:diguanylate cyclase (GGDEF)-like protein